MTDSNPQPDDRDSNVDGALTTYRCVCGDMISLRGGPAECSSCGRRYDSEVIEGALAETTLFQKGADGEDIALVAETVRDSDAFVGRRLGHFQLLGRIGGGGMGTVYRALDESLQRYVALKIINNSVGSKNDTVLERLFQEARAQARVNHPHVAHIYFVGIEDETPFLAMELVGDETLADRLKDGPLPFRDVIRYGLQMAEALVLDAQTE